MSPDVICGCCSLGFTGTYIKEKKERKGGVRKWKGGRKREKKRQIWEGWVKVLDPNEFHL